MKTMTQLMWAASILALVLALAHLAIAGFLAQRVWELQTLWFLGSGVALLLGALLNIITLRVAQRDLVVRNCLILGNTLVAGFFMLAVPLLKAPQALVGLVLYVGLTVGAMLYRPSKYAIPDPSA
jgi:membrane protein CcdC involved in cytochrome C biogenesis